MSHPPAQEPTPTLPLTPSRPEEKEPAVSGALSANAVLRGKLIHKLLEYLPEVEDKKRISLAKQYIQRHREQFSEAEQEEMISQTLAILNHPQFATIFDAGSRSEVPLVGVLGQYTLSGQIDRLLVEKDRVLIIDYKTGRIPPKDPRDVPLRYRRQMGLYKAALEKIYPEKTVRCAIIWTEIPLLMPLDEEILTVPDLAFSLQEAI